MIGLGDSRVTLVSDDEVSTNGKTTDSYETRKLEGRCVYIGCPSAPCGDRLLCDEHHEAAKERRNRSQNALREARRDAGLCPRCGKRETDDYMCLVCRVRYKRTARARAAGEDKREDKLAARLIPWENSPTNAGRIRLRGGKRGAPGKDEQDALERKIIERGVNRYLDAYRTLTSPEGKALSEYEKKIMRLEALSQLALAVRAADDVLDRNRFDEKLAKQADHPSEIVKSGR